MNWSDRARSRTAAGLAWIRAGRGEPVLMIHGVGLRAESMGGLQDALADAFSVFAVDLPGHGESDPLAEGARLEDHVDRMAGALAAIGSPAFVVGHSMGAMIGLELALRHPRLCRAVVALNAVYRRTADATRAVQERAHALATDAAADPAPTLRRWFGDALDSPEAVACRRWLTCVDRRAYQSAYAVFAHHDGPGDEELSALDCPALFATGADEPNSTPAMSKTMADLAPRGEALIVPGAAHMMPMTHAATLATVVRRFLAESKEAG